MSGYRLNPAVTFGLAVLPEIPRHELDYRVKRGRLAVFRPSGNPRGKRKVTLEAVREAYPEVYESLLQRASELEGLE